jgi:pyruvate dehydrogenase kinase 2/3/4
VSFQELESQLQSFLDHFYASRIAIRFLMGHYLAVHRDSLVPRHERTSCLNDHIGIICKKTRLENILHWAAQDARLIAQLWYGVPDIPEVHIESNLTNEYILVPSHVHHMLVELLKNSIRATIEKRTDPYEYEPIKIIHTEGSNAKRTSSKKDIQIAVVDKGKGMSESALQQVWSYFYTTAPPEDQLWALRYLLQEAYGSDGTMADSHNRAVPIAGLGYGIPITRLVRSFDSRQT